MQPQINSREILNGIKAKVQLFSFVRFLSSKILLNHSLRDDQSSINPLDGQPLRNGQRKSTKRLTLTQTGSDAANKWRHSITQNSCSLGSLWPVYQDKVALLPGGKGQGNNFLPPVCLRASRHVMGRLVSVKSTHRVAGRLLDHDHEVV